MPRLAYTFVVACACCGEPVCSACGEDLDDGSNADGWSWCRVCDCLCFDTFALLGDAVVGA
jgi:hypothetical protein